MGRDGVVFTPACDQCCGVHCAFRLFGNHFVLTIFVE
jgi:hypothetical protein